jgi:hypothetical protein
MIAKSSLLAGNGSVQTFLKDGLHVNSEPISEYILFEASSIAANTTKKFYFKDRNIAIALKTIWFTPSGTNFNATFTVRSETTNLYSIPIVTSANVLSLPLIIAKPNYDLAIVTPPGLSLTNVLIIAQTVYINDVIF